MEPLPFRNKTFLYLARALTLSGNCRPLLAENIVNYGAKHKEKEGLFILYNFKQINNFEQIYEVAKTFNNFMEEYLVDDPIYGQLHMFHFRIKKSIYNAFLASAYSKMYNKQELAIVCPNAIPSLLVLQCDEKIKETLAKKLNVNSDIIEELDEAIIPSQEFFENDLSEDQETYYKKWRV